MMDIDNKYLAKKNLGADVFHSKECETVKTLFERLLVTLDDVPTGLLTLPNYGKRVRNETESVMAAVEETNLGSKEKIELSKHIAIRLAGCLEKVQKKPGIHSIARERLGMDEIRKKLEQIGKKMKIEQKEYFKEFIGQLEHEGRKDRLVVRH
ncbi:hypothetical protein KJ780_00960 [Candidatus Micrarchaeota archaeon]|nr:hypothetical protein [Candidatus Micrarchaeota archaeon]